MSTTLNMLEEFRQFRIEELERENERLKRTLREINSPDGLTNFMGKPVDYWLNLEVEVETYRQQETCMCGSPVATHNIGSGHSPVSVLDYRLGNTESENKRLIGIVEEIRSLVVSANINSPENMCQTFTQICEIADKLEGE